MEAKEPIITYNGITFNDFTNPESMFLATDIPEGLIRPDIRDSASERVGNHGAVFGPNTYGRRFFVLSGKIIGVDQDDRVSKEKSLSEAFVLPRSLSDIEASFRTIEILGEDLQTKVGRARVSSPLTLSKEFAEPWYRDFTVTLEFEKFYLEGDIEKELELQERVDRTNFFVVTDTLPQWVENTETLVYSPEITFEAENEGNFGASAYIVVYGKVSNPEIINDTTGKSFKVLLTVGIGEELHIDSENGTVFLYDTIGTRTDKSALITDDSEFIFIEPGINELRIEDDQPQDSDFTAKITFKDTFI